MHIFCYQELWKKRSKTGQNLLDKSIRIQEQRLLLMLLFAPGRGKKERSNCHNRNDAFTVCRKVWINCADLPYLLLLSEIFVISKAF